MLSNLTRWTSKATISPRTNRVADTSVEFSVEHLEDRKLLAGDISVTVNDGDLEIRGERNTDQGLMISATETPGQYSIEGFETTINGEESVTVQGVTGDFDFQMRTGAKLVILTEGDESALIIGGDLDIDTTGGSDDIIILDEVVVKGDTSVSTSGGEDAITLAGGQYEDRARFNTGAGNDVITDINNTRFMDELDIRTGGGVDYVMLASVQASEETDIRTGGGEDFIGLYENSFAEIEVRGGGRIDAMENFDNTFDEFEQRSVEQDFDDGFSVMFAQARNANDTFNSAIIVFAFYSLGS